MFRRALQISARKLHSKQLMYNEYGDPTKVINVQTVELPDKVPDGHALIRWLAAPINPADLNQIQGVYPEKPNSLPAVGGNDGYGVVEQIGSGVTCLKKGDNVLRGLSPPGTWRTFGHHKADDLYKIEPGLPLEAAATLQVNPPTAYRMLKDFVNLKPDDVIIQNGATSAVGRAVIQICKAWGIKSVNLVRSRDDMTTVINDLKSLGADLVITEEQLIKEYRKEVKDVALALNCVGGRGTMFLASVLRQGGAMVTYGGMSKQPLQIPTGPLIFKDIKLAGFWLTRWSKDRKNDQEKNIMFKDLGKLIKEGKLTPPNCEIRSLDEGKEAVDKALNVFGCKQLFKM